MRIGLERPTSDRNLVDILDRVLDKGMVIDARLGLFSLAGISLVTVEARVLVTSIETYLQHSDALSEVTPAAWPASRATPQSVLLVREPRRAETTTTKATSPVTGLAHRLGMFRVPRH